MSKTAKIDVAVRVRPLLENEKMDGLRQTRLKANPSNSEIRLVDPEGKNNKVYAFDKVCSNNCSQEEFYQTVGMNKYIDRVLEGYHATVFVYGQTGSGKTFTMEGIEYDLPVNRPTQRKPNKIVGMREAGLIPRVIRDLFQKIAVTSKKLNRNYNIYCSFLELYNEKIYDLLNPDQLNRISAASPGLKLRWHKKDQFLVENLYVFACSSPEELEFLFHMGVKNKTMASHRLNSSSSRSHCIFEIKIEYFDSKSPDDVIVSKFALVDLAGSERSSMVTSEGRMAKEAIEINKSLFTLRQVINAIHDSQNRGSKNEHHIPYRESKLTSLLKQSIGGNSYCLMIACLSPSDENYEENLSTLSYATKVTKIQNEPIKNDDPRWKVIQELKIQNVDLLQKLDDANQQILSLTQGIHRKVQKSSESTMRPKRADGTQNTEEDHYQREPGAHSQTHGNQNFSPSNHEKSSYITNGFGHPTDPNSENMVFSENLTQQLVVAINQIRDLLEALKRERERNEDLIVKLEDRENVIATLMRENQELRDSIIQLETAPGPGADHSGPLRTRDRATSGSSKHAKSPYLRGLNSTTGYTMNNSFHDKDRNDRNSALSQTNTSFKSSLPMPKIRGQSPKMWAEAKNDQQQQQQMIQQEERENPNDISNYIPTQENLHHEHHYRTTTMFARNIMYRKGNSQGGKGQFSETMSEFHASFVDKNKNDKSFNDDLTQDKNSSINLDTYTQATPKVTNMREDSENGFIQMIKDRTGKLKEQYEKRKDLGSEGQLILEDLQKTSQRRSSAKPRAVTPMDRTKGMTGRDQQQQQDTSVNYGRPPKGRDSFH